MHTFVSLIKKYQSTFILLLLLAVLSFIYATHLELKLIPKGYDLLFHLGNVFSLQVAFSFTHKSFASLAISPIIFHDYGYATHAFYPPLAHFIPAVISFVLSKIGINSTISALRLFSFLTLYFTGLSMYFAAKKISNNTIYASFASILYLSAPYLQWDYYWRGGMSSSLCFVFLPLLLLSIYYFTKEKYAPYFFTFVTALSLLAWTHLITAFYSFILFMIAIGINFFFLKKKKAALITTLVGGMIVGVLTSPFWILLLQQQAMHTHVIYSSEYPFSITSVAHSIIPFKALFDIQFLVWQWKIRNIFALFSLITVIFFITFVALIKPIKKSFERTHFFFTLVGLLILLLALVTTTELWLHLPSFFAFIQYPHRLLLQATPILSLLIALPFILIRKTSVRGFIVLAVIALFIVGYTFKFNNYALYDIGKIDYTTFSILQATGVDHEYLPVNAKKEMENLEKRPRLILAQTHNLSATPSAQIVINETPYLLAKIEKNENKETLFELPRLYYGGYELRWKPDGSTDETLLPYGQSKGGLMNTYITGNGTLEVQFTGGKWYWLSWVGFASAFGYLGWLIYNSFIKKKRIWIEKI